MNKHFLLIFVLLVFCGTIDLFGLGKKDKKNEVLPDFMLGNGTGSNITEIQIRPSKRTYSDNDLALSFENISLPDTQGFAVILPNDWKDIYYFDIAIKYKNGDGKAKTKERVHIDRGRKMPLLIMHIGKNSTIPLTAGGATASAAAGGITALAAGFASGALVLTLPSGTVVTGAAAITAGLAAIGSIVGGGMATGIGIIVAAPVVLGATIFGITSWLSIDNLDVTQISY